jgi:cystathionine gamma-synthase
MKKETLLVQVGMRQDKETGAISIPIHHSTTFAHEGLGETTGYYYSRSANPTRNVLEEALAQLEKGCRGFAFASGMAAIHAVLTLFNSEDHLIVSDDLYGGTYRLFEQIFCRYGLKVSYVDTSNLEAVERAITKDTRAIFIESPTNPTMKITDIAACATLAETYSDTNRHRIFTIVDNTFLTPYFQQPLVLGADIVVHSATKYLGGHNDVLAGAVIVRDKALGEQIAFIQNSIGAVLGPDDCWLLLRGLKTLALRMERHEANALKVAKWLVQHPGVEQVFYPGLESHAGYDVQTKQSTGYGGMLSFEVVDERMVNPLLRSVGVVTFAESLGGVESLITYPVTQTHADIPEEVRNAHGVTNRLLRISIGIEHIDDILDDLNQALDVAVTQAVTHEI